MDFNKQVSRIEIWFNWFIMFRTRQFFGIAQRDRLGTSDPKRKRRRKDEAVDPEHFEWLWELLSADPHLEYDEMCGRISESFDVEYTPRQIRFCCHENKITRKKLELQAREQDDVEMASFRTAVRLDFQGGIFEKTSFFGATNLMERELGWGEHMVSLIADCQHFGGCLTRRVTLKAVLQLHFSIVKAFLKPGYSI